MRRHLLFASASLLALASCARRAREKAADKDAAPQATDAPPVEPETVSDKGIEVADIEALKEAARSAEPGARILVAPGTYRGGCALSGVRGAPGALVEIAAKNPGSPPVFDGGDMAFQLLRSSYVIVDSIAATGARINNVQVAKCDHIILKNVFSHDIAGTGNCDGIKMPGVTDFLIHGSRVEAWGGEGSAVDMVGCARWLLMKCTFAYPQLKGQTANALQPKGGTHSMGIFRCLFTDASLRAIQFGGATGKQYFFRGNLDSGYEGMDMAAMGNVIVSGGAAVAYVSCTNCTAEYNTIVNPRKYVMRILKEGGTRPTAGNTFARNLIVYGKLSQVLNHGGDVDVPSFTFADNYWYSSLWPKKSIPKLPAAQVSAAGGEDPKLDGSFRPADDGPARAYGAHAPGLAEAWARHTDKFTWAWGQARRIEGE